VIAIALVAAVATPATGLGALARSVVVTTGAGPLAPVS
jgi:hypothetical protein